MRIAAAILSVTALTLVPTAAPGARALAADWTRTVAATPAGGFRIGNPNAKVKLVEYGSLACSHCRHFEQTGYKPLLQQYVRSGRVSFEFRSLLINGPDISVSLLARCAGRAKFFAMSEFVFATQPQWLSRFEDISDGDQAEIEKMTIQQRIVRFAEIGGLPRIAARFGVTPARARQCLSDGKELQRLLDMTKAAVDAGIDGTPTFVLNGKILEKTATWEDLQPKLRAALGG